MNNTIRVGVFLMFIVNITLQAQNNTTVESSLKSVENKQSEFNTLIWADEFDTEGPIDDDKWFHQTQLPTRNSWYNGEIQHYTDREANTYVEDGILKIVARRETFTDQGVTKNFTSARLNSKFAFTYGRVEIRAKLPVGVGTWPALWMLGKNINERGAYWYNQGFGTTNWPDCGEVDIMEHWGSNQNHVSSAMHTPSSYGGTVNKGGQYVSTASTEFHVYALEWTEEKMVFSVDDQEHYTYNPSVKNEKTWPFDSDQYLLMNIAVLSKIQDSFTQSAMEVDYVRIYQSTPTSINKNINDSQFKVYPDHSMDFLYLESASVMESVAIYTIGGKKIFLKNALSNNEKVDIRDYKRGIYIVKVSFDGVVKSQKFIKN